MGKSKRKSFLKDCIKTGKLLSEAEQIELVKLEDRGLLKAYLEKHFLCDMAEYLLIVLKNKALFKERIKDSFLSDDEEIWLVEHGNEAMFELYIKDHFLSEAAVRSIIALKNKALLEIYLKQEGHLSESADHYLITHGNEELAGVYLLYRPFDSDFQMKIVREANLEVFQKFAQKYACLCFSDEAQLELLKSGHLKKIEVYIRQEPWLCEKAKQFLLKTEDTDLLKIIVKDWLAIR